MKNPETHQVRGYIYRISGIAHFTMNDLETQHVEGIFVSNHDFAGAFREVGACPVRLRGKFIG